jgi:drug/metabolite transporter (DMT)-like permease
MRLAWAAWIVVCVVWGTTYLGIRVALETVPVFLLAGLRWVGAGLLLAAVLSAMGRRLPGPRTWGTLVLLGFLMNVLGNGFVVWAEQFVSSGLTAVVVATVTFWSVCIESWLPNGERLTARTLAGLALGFAGIVVLLWPEMTVGGGAGRAVVGGVLGLQVACAGWALGTSYSKRHTTGGDPLTTSALQMIFGGLILLAIATLRGEWSDLQFSARTLVAMLYLTLAGSVVAYTAYIYAIAYLPISTVSLYAYVNPIIAVVLGSLLLDEPFSMRIVFASLLVLAGIAVVRGVQSRRVAAPATRRAHA